MKPIRQGGKLIKGWDIIAKSEIVTNRPLFWRFNFSRMIFQFFFFLKLTIIQNTFERFS